MSGPICPTPTAPPQIMFGLWTVELAMFDLRIGFCASFVPYGWALSSQFRCGGQQKPKIKEIAETLAKHSLLGTKKSTEQARRGRNREFSRFLPRLACSVDFLSPTGSGVYTVFFPGPIAVQVSRQFSEIIMIIISVCFTLQVQLAKTWKEKQYVLDEED